MLADSGLLQDCNALQIHQLAIHFACTAIRHTLIEFTYRRHSEIEPLLPQ